MAELQSPGVSVTVSDDSISAASANGTVPLFIIATAQDKLITGSNAVATGTTKATAGQLQLITSQRNALEIYGSPIFQKNNGSVVQGDELNEYGLQSLYSYMGIANRAYVVRADIDLAQLAPSAVEPTGPVPNGTLWLDTRTSQVEAYVAKVQNPQSYHDWAAKTVEITSSEDIADIDTSFMNVDDLVLNYVPSTGEFSMYKFSATGLVQVNTILSPINKVPTVADVGDIWIRDGYTKNGSNYFGTRLNIKRYASLTSVWVEVNVWTGNTLYDVEAKAGTFDNTYIASLYDNGVFSLYMKSGSTPTVSAEATPAEDVVDGDKTVTVKFLNKSYSVVVVEDGEVPAVADIITKLNAVADLINSGFTFTGTDSLVITNKKGYSFSVTAQDGIFEDATVLSTDSSNYSVLNHDNLFVQEFIPTAKAKDGTYWYNFSNSDSLDVGLYVADVLTNEWKLVDPETDMYVQLDEPAADREFWVQPLSQGIEGYVFYRNVQGEWSKLDETDQSTVNGIIFDDFTLGNVPAAELYQNGMLAVDLGTTEGVVKVMENGVWTVASGVALDGSGVFGRAAQRQIIVEALASVIVSNQDIRAESIQYNLMCCPGYVETLDELITLNTDRKETAFIVTDVPARLSPSAMAVQEWATNANNAPSNGDIGRTSGYDYAAQYMGWVLSTNVDGEEVAVPGSTAAMRVYAYSDQISRVWFPPAGTERGVVTNAASVGYINEESEYTPVVYNQGQRDTMYINKINPIAMRPNRGLLVFGDKTLAPEDSSALSRVNVARLVVYIRTQLAIIAEPFLFRLNTPSTRQEFVSVVNGFLSEIVQLNGINDFLAVCDESNNTPDRINANELWMDIAIVPTRSINFIYVPIRIQNDLSQ